MLNTSSYKICKISKITEIGVRRVIDLHVVKNHSFLTKNGIVTHNCDFLSQNAQAGLRDLTETVQKNTRFFFLANYPQKIIDPIKSRCQTISLNDPPKDQILRHCFKIFKAENIEVKNKTGVVEIIKAHYPDIRQIINTLQLNCVNGVFDSVKISSTSDVFESIYKNMKSHEIDEIRKILRSEGIDYPELFNFLYEKAPETKSPGDFIISIGEYLYRDSSVAIKEINFMAFYFEMMKKGIL